MFVNTSLIKQIHTLLSQLGRSNDKEFKKDLVLQYSKGRAESTKELYYAEGLSLVAALQKMVGVSKEAQDRDRKRKAIISVAHTGGWQQNGKADIDRINGWCQQYGQFKKPFNDHTSKELNQLLRQFKKALNVD